jgi:hypothetical protein
MESHVKPIENHRKPWWQWNGFHGFSGSAPRAGGDPDQLLGFGLFMPLSQQSVS